VIWSVNLSDTDSRTMSVEEIVQGYASGLVTADAFVWKDGMADWVALLESELAPLLAAMPNFTAPNQATAAARPAATRAQSQLDNTQDLFGGIDTAGADEEVATSAPIIPQAGTSAYGDGNLTGARNENSVLFSLDALKAGFSPSAPAAKSSPKAPNAPAGGGRPQQASNPDDPFGMGASAGLMGVGGGALFGANNQALLTAPAPPPPPPPPTPAQVGAGVAPTAGGKPANNKLVLIVGGVSGVVIIGLILALVLGRKHDDTAPTAEGSASPSASTAPANTAPEEKQAEPAPKAEVAPAASASAVPAASASVAPAASASATKPAEKPTAVASVTGAKPADTAKKKEDPIPPGPSDAPAFSKSSAISALTAASMSAATCKKPGGPTGSGKATVTFAPSGRVTTATVGGAFAGTPSGGCVASVFRRAHVPAFSGSAVTVSKSFTID
jgi:hypothetical protein